MFHDQVSCQKLQLFQVQIGSGFATGTNVTGENFSCQPGALARGRSPRLSWSQPRRLMGITLAFGKIKAEHFTRTPQSAKETSEAHSVAARALQRSPFAPSSSALSPLCPGNPAVTPEECTHTLLSTYLPTPTKHRQTDNPSPWLS